MTMLALLLALLLQPVEKHWLPLSNLPGWEGYGTILPSGWIDPEKFRRTSDRFVEVLPAGVVPAMESSRRVAVSSSASSGDPYGFLGWLNSLRASRGLPPVGYDPSLSGWAAQNNLAQSTHGMGHHVMGTARRQNAGMGDAVSVWSMWTTSPSHAAALFDPTIRWVGIAFTGVYWTYSAY